MLALAAGLLLATCAVAGCEWFRPDDPETSDGDVIVPNYAQPDSVLETMAQAIANKGATNGQSAYIGAFADSSVDARGFHAFFDPQTINRLEQSGTVIPDDWGYGDESNFYLRLIRVPEVPPNSDYIMQWLPDPTQGLDEIDAERAILYRQYRLFAVPKEGELQGEFLPVARGLVTLEMVALSTTRWGIVRWQDREWPGADRENGEISMGERRLE